MRSTIVLVDQHPSIRIGLRSALACEPTLRVVGEAADAIQGRLLIAAKRPSLVIIEAILPDGDGIAMAAEMERSFKGLRALILTVQTASFSSGARRWPACPPTR